MVRQNLVLYISSQLRQGVPWSDLNGILLAKGWKEEEIIAAVNYIQDTSGRPIEKTNVKINVPKLSLHMLVIFLLIMLTVGGIFTVFVLNAKPEAVANTSVPAVVK